MDNPSMFDTILQLIESPVGVSLIWAATVGLFIFLASRFNPLQEFWKNWEGSIITGIRLAEQNIPDDTPNSGLARLDSALRFVLRAYAEANDGKQPSAKQIQELKQGIQIKHDELDRYGTLTRRKETS